MSLYRIPVAREHVRSIDDPNFEGIKTHYALVRIDDFPEKLSLSPDPRVPKPNNVTRRISASLEAKDGLFHILNRGITISAFATKYNADEGLLELDIPDDDCYGILDGGHTQMSIHDVRQELPKPRRKAVTQDGEPLKETHPQYVRLEILTGVEKHLARIASARNYSERVKEISLATYERKLDWLMEAVGEEWAKQVRWSENDPDKKIDALELIQIITALNITRFPEGEEPLEAYKNAGKCLDYIVMKDDKYAYRSMAPVIPEIWWIYDEIRLRWWPLYNMKDETGRGGKAGKLEEVTKRKRGQAKLMQFVTHGDDTKGKMLHVERGLVMPLLAGFRALLKLDPQLKQYVWVTDSRAFFDRHGKVLIQKVMDASDQRGNNPNQVGRDKTVYSQLYEAIDRLRLKDMEMDREALELQREPTASK